MILLYGENMGCRELQLNNYFHFSGDNISSHKETEVNEEKNGNGFNHPCKFVFIRGSEEFQTIVTNPNVTNPNAYVTPEAGVGGTAAYLLYDGHGSTRLLTSATSAISARYNYDAYGKILGGFPNVTNPNAHATQESGGGGTDMLYSGEQFDPNLQMQYLRARYYDQSNGRFNRLDPFNGNAGDPQSLHKYAYAHCEPVMGIDPGGLMTLGEVMVASFQQLTLKTVFIQGSINAVSNSIYTLIAQLVKGKDPLRDGNIYELWESATVGFISGALLAPLTITSKLAKVAKIIGKRTFWNILSYIVVPGFLKGFVATTLTWYKEVAIERKRWSPMKIFLTLASSVMVSTVFQTFSFGIDKYGQSKHTDANFLKLYAAFKHYQLKRGEIPFYQLNDVMKNIADANFRSNIAQKIHDWLDKPIVGFLLGITESLSEVEVK